MGSASRLPEPLLADPVDAADADHIAGSAEPLPSSADSQPLASGATAATAATAQAAESLGPLGSLNPLSAATFAWVSQLLRRGSTQEQLHQRDLFALPPHLLPATCGQRLLNKWRQEQQRAQRAGSGVPPSLLRAIVAAYGRPYFWLGLLKLASDALNFAGPMLLNLLLRHLAADPARHPKTLGSSSGSGGGSATLSLLGWHADVAAPAFGYACAVALAGSLVLKAFLSAHFGYRQALIASQLRSSVTIAVFRKALAVNSATLAATGSGRVQTLMSVDADRLVNLCVSFHDLWSLPAQIAIALWLLYTQVQFAFLAGLALVLLLIPINRVLANRIQAASVQMMGAKDRRVRVMMEALRGIRQIKCYSWEALFASKVREERSAELEALAVRKYLDALCVYFWAATSLLFSITTFGLYALMGRPLTAQVVFTSLALFNVLLAPINSFPWVLNGVVEALVSVRRVAEFLHCPETAGPCSRLTLSSSSSSGGGDRGIEAAVPPAVSLQGSFMWGSGQGSNTRHGSGSDGGCGASNRRSDGSAAGQRTADQGDQPVPVLQDVQLEVLAGTLVAITGTVGSGKSSLLSAMLGEMLPCKSSREKSAGVPNTACPGAATRCTAAAGQPNSDGAAIGGCIAPGSSVAYAPQDTFILHGTLRENILFGAPPEPRRYQAVLHACALLPDLGTLPAGDQTVAGGAGATLSGGQRARLALARALYRDADVLLLDDCLAAVDAKVAAWILRHALLGPLLWGPLPPGGASGQQGEQLPGAHRQEQQQQQQQQPPPPPPQQLQPCLRTVIVATHAPELLAAADLVVEMRDGCVAAVRHQPGAANRRAAAAAEAAAGGAWEGGGGWPPVATKAEEGEQAAAGGIAHHNDLQHRPQQAQQAQQVEEERQTGHVRWAVYQRYAAATGWGWVTLILGSLLLMQATRNGNDLWLSRWVSHTPSAAAPAAVQRQQLQQQQQQQQHRQQQQQHHHHYKQQVRQQQPQQGQGQFPAQGIKLAQLIASPSATWWCGSAVHPGIPLPACTLLANASSGIACTTAAGSASLGPSGSTGGDTTASWRAAGSSHRKGGIQSGRPPLDPTVRFYLTGLLVIAAINSIITLVRAFSFAKGGLVAAQRVHEQLLAAVLGLPLAFFDATPPGRILNRFSSDTATVDDSLPFILNILLAYCASLAGIATVLCLTQPLVLVLLPPLAFAYRQLQRYYRATSRELRRLDSVAKSPVYTAFSEVLAGGPVMRAFGAQRHFLSVAETAVAAQQRASVTSAAAGSWLGLRLQFIAAALAAAVAVAAVAQHAGVLPWAVEHSSALGWAADQAASSGGSASDGPALGHSMAAGLVGLSLSYVMPITGLLSGLLSASAETEQEMVAVERVFQYVALGGSGDATPGRPAALQPPPTLPLPLAQQSGNAAAHTSEQAGSPMQHALLQPLLSHQPPPASLDVKHSHHWLRAGHVHFENVWLRYDAWQGGPASGTSGITAASSAASALQPGSSSGGGDGGSGSSWVLCGVSLDIQPGSHVGICGRTGAGKSSLLAALLRLTPIASGRITIDGTDVAALPPKSLRRALGVVPQHPFLFEGTIRDNLDPVHQHSMAELAAALRSVHLWHPLLAQLPGRAAAAGGPAADSGSAAGFASGAAPAAPSTAGSASSAFAAAAATAAAAAGHAPDLEQGCQAAAAGPAGQEAAVLSLSLGEGAAALSQGQQQLLALARVLLRAPRLLLLDEATSSVDPATADVMHEVIRRELPGATIIEVAHRQATIASCDRVVVMEAGQVVEQQQQQQQQQHVKEEEGQLQTLPRQ